MGLPKTGEMFKVREISRATNISPPQVSRILNGHSVPNLKNARSLAKYFGVSLDKFADYLSI